MRKIDCFLTESITYICKSKVHSNIYGLARSLIAFGTFLTLVFNDVHALFPSKDPNTVILNPFSKINEISIFSILQNYPIEYAKYFCVFILVLVIIGIYPKITCILHWWVTFSFFVSCIFVDGGDQISMIVSLMLIPICLTDNRKWHWNIQNNESGTQKIIAYISLLMIRIQVAVIYFHAGTAKLNVFEWLNGTAIYYWSNHNIFGMPHWIKPILDPLLYNSVSIVLLTWSAILLEICLFLCLVLNKKYWQLFLIAGLSFHFFILLIHGLVSFFFAMAGVLILYLRPLNSPFTLFNKTVWLKKLLKS